MELKDKKVSVVLEDNKKTQQTIMVDQILVAVGRSPNTRGIGLEDLEWKQRKVLFRLGDYYQTNVPVYSP